MYPGHSMSSKCIAITKEAMDTSSRSLISLPWLLILPLILISLFFLIKKRKKPADNNLPPGPPTLPIIGNLHQIFGKIPHQALCELSKTYGPVMLLKLGKVPNLVVSSPEMAKQVMKTHDLECCSRPRSYGTAKLSYNLSDMSFSPYSAYWREMRKVCVIELFTAKRVKSFSHVRDAEVSKLIDSLSQLEGKSVNLSDELFYMSNEITCQIAFGKSYQGKQFKNANCQDVLNETFSMCSVFWAADFFPTFGWIIDRLMGLHKRLDKAFNNFDEFFDRVIDEHLDPARKDLLRKDYVDILLGLVDDQSGPFRLTRNHVKAMLMDIYTGGVDTSSITIAWAMTELAKNPRVMRKVQAEIRTVIGNNPKANENELENLPYLKMVVKETLRLHPPATFLGPRESMKQCKIGGYEVSPKTRILVNAWAIGRDPNVWMNPEEFYPERFEDNAIDFKGSDFKFVPFGAGRRICPGLTMGSTLVEYSLANLLHSFNWKLPIGMEIEDINMEEEPGLTTHKKFPLYLVPIMFKCED